MQTSWHQQIGADRHRLPHEPCRTIRGTNMDQVERVMERPKLYNNIDGVGELGMGFMCLGFALLTWLQAQSPRGAIWHKVYVVLPLMLLMASIIDYGSKTIKKHVTYPRTGFVEYKKRDNVDRKITRLN